MFKVKRFSASLDEAMPRFHLYLIYIGSICFFFSNIHLIAFVGGVSMFIGLALWSVRETVGEQLKSEIDDYVGSKYGQDLRKAGIQRIGIFVDSDKSKILTSARNCFFKGEITPEELKELQCYVSKVGKEGIEKDLPLEQFEGSIPYINIFIDENTVKVLGSKQVLKKFTDWQLKRYIDNVIVSALTKVNMNAKHILTYP